MSTTVNEAGENLHDRKPFALRCAGQCLQHIAWIAGGLILGSLVFGHAERRTSLPLPAVQSPIPQAQSDLPARAVTPAAMCPVGCQDKSHPEVIVTVPPAPMCPVGCQNEAEISAKLPPF